jgi:hypothetical protein
LLDVVVVILDNVSACLSARLSAASAVKWFFGGCFEQKVINLGKNLINLKVYSLDILL